MEKNRKDMLKPVIITVFIHLILIFAVYLSLKKDNPKKIVDLPLSANSAHSSRDYFDSERVENSEALMTLTETPKNAEEEDKANPEEDIEKNTEKASESEKNAESKSESAAASNDLDNQKDTAAQAIPLQDTPSKTPTRDAPESRFEATAPNQSRAVFDDNEIVYVKDGVVLLNRDLPQSITKSAMPTGIAQAKMEAEMANDELSGAINEVKRRNQQQIEQREQEKSQQ